MEFAPHATQLVKPVPMEPLHAALALLDSHFLQRTVLTVVDLDISAAIKFALHVPPLVLNAPTPALALHVHQETSFKE